MGFAVMPEQKPDGVYYWPEADALLVLHFVGPFWIDVFYKKNQKRPRQSSLSLVSKDFIYLGEL